MKTLKQNRIRYSYQGQFYQFVITMICTLGALFALIPLFITIINSLKIDDEVAKNVFSLPSNQIFSAIANNYATAWNAIGTYFTRTIIVAIVGAVCVTLLGALLAYILVFKDFYLKNFVFMLFIAVLLIPSIIGYPILVPLMRDTFKLGDTYAGLLIPYIGGNQVGAMFLFRTFFSAQPKAIYESARLDGASELKIFFTITVPLAIPILLYFFISAFSGIYNEYLYSSLILDSKLILMPKMYSLVDSQNIKYGSMYAMYVISSVPLIVTTFISMKYFTSGEFASGMKL